MLLSAMIQDSQTGIPIIGATVSLQQIDGTFVPIGYSDDTGTISIDVGSNTAVLQIGSVGYNPIQLTGAALQLTDIITLVPATIQEIKIQVPSATTQAIQAANGINAPAAAPASTVPWIWIIGGGAALLLLAGGSKKKKVAGFDWEELIVPALVIGGGYLLLSNAGSLFSSNANASNNAAIQQTTTAGNQQLVAQAQAAGAQATLSQSQVASLAADIYAQGTSSSGIVSAAAQQQIVADLAKCMSLLDYANLKTAFGTKSANGYFSTCNFIGINCQLYDLDSFIKACCDPTTVTAINTILATNGVNYQL